MPSNNPEIPSLTIRCPKCEQRFKVADGIRDRLVKCGSCEHQFKVEDSVIVKSRRVYPGEHKDPMLGHFQRTEGTSVIAHEMPQLLDANAPTPAIVEISPARVIFGIFGVLIMLITASLLIFGATKGGALDGMPTVNRVIMSCFVGVMGASMLGYANRKYRLAGIFVGVLLCSGLISLPFIFTDGSSLLTTVPLENGMGPVKVPGNDSTANPEVIPKQNLREVIGMKPLEIAIQRMADDKRGLKAVGIWICGLKERNRYLIRDYIIRETGGNLNSRFYPRGKDNFLFVVTDIHQSLDQIATIVSGIGSDVKIHDDIQVVEVRVNNDQFKSGPIELLTNPENPVFYDLNKNELESIDLDRVASAVKRLSAVEPKLYRSDISKCLIALLTNDWIEDKGQVCAALAVWAEQPGPAGEAALTVANQMLAKNKEVPVDVVALIVKEKNPKVIPLIHGLWLEKPARWEMVYANVGPAAEPLLLKTFQENPSGLRESTIRILERIGGSDSLAVLKKAQSDPLDAETKILIENAVRAISDRLKPKSD